VRHGSELEVRTQALERRAATESRVSPRKLRAKDYLESKKKPRETLVDDIGTRALLFGALAKLPAGWGPCAGTMEGRL
jgi:hypothetical protein